MSKKLIVAGIGALIVSIIAFMSIGVQVVEGDERAVVQDWNDGVLGEVWTAGTHFYIPLTTKPYVYKIGSEKFIMGRAEYYNGDGSDYVDYKAFTITSGGQGKEQIAEFSVTLNYRLNPVKLVVLHKQAQDKYEDLIIKPALTRIISDLATTQTVLDFYSGAGRVQLQKDIEKAITEHPSLSKVGIVVDTFVIDSINLDKQYVQEITGRQLATQKKLRAIEEAKAAEEVAKKVEAEAQASKLKKIVEAEAKKQERIKAAEAKAAEVELDAKAQRFKAEQQAKADRFRKEEDSKGLLAQGLAEAKVALQKKVSRYEGIAGARQAAVEIERAKTDRLKNMNISGIIPEKAAITLIDGTSLNNTVLSVPVKK